MTDVLYDHLRACCAVAASVRSAVAIACVCFMLLRHAKIAPELLPLLSLLPVDKPGADRFRGLV